METKEKNLKQKILYEFQMFSIYATFLTLFFCSLTFYRRLILDQYALPYIPYGSNVIQAFILAKLILLGETFQLGEKYKDRPLIIPTIYKTIVFSVFVVFFTIAEHLSVGYFKGQSMEKIYEEFLIHGIYVILAKAFVIFLFFILFFAFLEISRVMGEGRLFNLFFIRKNSN